MLNRILLFQIKPDNVSDLYIGDSLYFDANYSRWILLFHALFNLWCIIFMTFLLVSMHYKRSCLFLSFHLFFILIILLYLYLEAVLLNFTTLESRELINFFWKNPEDYFYFETDYVNWKISENYKWFYIVEDSWFKNTAKYYYTEGYYNFLAIKQNFVILIYYYGLEFLIIVLYRILPVVLGFILYSIFKLSNKSQKFTETIFWASIFLLVYFQLYLFSIRIIFPIIFKFHYIPENFWVLCDLTWFSWDTYSFHFILGFDGLSLMFIELVLFLFPICFFILRSWPVQFQNSETFCILLFLVEILLLLAFSSLDILIFFLIFEVLIIPLGFVIGFYGSREERLSAFRYTFMYSAGFSLSSLFGVLYLLYSTKTTNYILLSELAPILPPEKQYIIWFFLFVALSAKVPMFPFHLWLPKAHVESNTVGSMVLAGLLLKLGGFGIFRFLIALFPAATLFFSPLVKTLALVGIFVSSIAALVQLDLKKIIAYSSVAHMNLHILGFFSITYAGMSGALFGMLSHGIVTSALFFLIGKIQDVYGSRNILYLGGLVRFSPLLASYFFFFSLCNTGFPGTGNFISECFISFGLFSSNRILFLFTIFPTCFAIIYSIRAFSFTFFGTTNKSFEYNMSLLWLSSRSKDLTYAELLCCNIFLFTTLFMGLKPSLFLNDMVGSIIKVLELYNN